MSVSHPFVGKVVFIGGDWTRVGRYLRHNQCYGVLFRYVPTGDELTNLVRITSVVS